MTVKSPMQIAFEIYPEATTAQNALRAVAAAAIERDRAQRTYVATIQEEGYDPHRMTVTPEPGESIVEAIILRGGARAEWTLIDVRSEVWVGTAGTSTTGIRSQSGTRRTTTAPGGSPT